MRLKVRLGVIFVLAGLLLLTPVKATKMSDTKELPQVTGVIFVQVPDTPNGKCGLHMEQFRIVRRPTNARIVSLIPPEPTGTLKVLTPEFATAVQPELSYDGKKVIFSAKKTPESNWEIWEMNIDGTGKRQITKDLGDCIEPCYLQDGRIVFSCGAPDFRDEYDRDIAKPLYTCNADGSNPRRITFNLSSDTSTFVLDDGRLFFTSWQHHGDHISVAGVFSFATCNPDGTVFMPFMGNHREAANTKSYAQQLTDGRIVFVESAGHRLYKHGGLATCLKEKPLTSRRVLTPGVVTSGYNLAGRFGSPYPLPDGGMVCSYSPGRATGPLLEDPAEDPKLGIYHFDFRTGRQGKLIFDAPHMQDIDVVAIYPRPKPPIIPSLVNPEKKTGFFLCVNPYLSDRPERDLSIVGELPPAKPGEIKGVRVVEAFGVMDKDPNKHRRTVIEMLQMSFGSNSNNGNNFEQKRILGYAPAEADGSFYIEVPADTTINLQTLDANGMAIETQLTWVWVRPGEVRFCVGCHESREMALTNLDCMAMRRGKPHFVAPEQKDRRTVDFRRDIMPIVEKKCATPNCHDSKSAKGNLDLGGGMELVFHRKGYRGRSINGAFFNKAYEGFLQAWPGKGTLGRLVRPSAAKHSPLIWRLYGKQLGINDKRAPYKGPLTQMPPGTPLTDAEKKLFVEWVDIGAQWDNIPAEDDLPGYDAEQSKMLAKIESEKIKQPLSDPKEAFEIRCMECHDNQCLLMGKAKKRTTEEWIETIDRMVNKRKGWIHDSELPLITEHTLKYWFVKK